jgi:hypothetical protein
VNAVMNIRVPFNARNLAGWELTSFSERTLLDVVSLLVVVNIKDIFR